jgi:hypothetical protein
LNQSSESVAHKEAFMKGITLFTVIMVAGAVGSSPVFSSDASFIGLKNGYVVSSQRGRDAGKGYQSTDRLSMGVFGQVYKTRHFIFQPELLFVKKGAKIFNNDLLMEDHVFTYAECPFLVQFVLPLKDAAVKPFLSTGPSVSLLLDSKNGSTKKIEYTRGVEYSWNIGLGIIREFGKNLVILEARYNSGMSSVIDNPNIAGAEDLKNTAFSINISYGFSN